MTPFTRFGILTSDWRPVALQEARTGIATCPKTAGTG